MVYNRDIKTCTSFKDVRYRHDFLLNIGINNVVNTMYYHVNFRVKWQVVLLQNNYGNL